MDNVFSISYLSIFKECGIDPGSEIPIAKQEPNPLPRRKMIDDIVFDALGLTEESARKSTALFAN